MKKISLFIVLLILLPMIFVQDNIGYAKDKDKGEIKNYKDISGITDKEIEAIEKLQGKTLIYASLKGTEGFINQDGEFSGFSKELMELLEELFEIDIEHKFVTWDEMVDGIKDGTVDFLTDFAITKERKELYYMSEPISERGLVYIKSKEGLTLQDIQEKREPVFVFLEGSITEEVVRTAYNHDFKSIYVKSEKEIINLLKEGGADAHFVDDTEWSSLINEGSFEIGSLEFPAYRTFGLTAIDESLECLISAFDKYLENGGDNKILELNIKGKTHYNAYKFLNDLTSEEIEYLQKLIASDDEITVGCQVRFYPICFYNEVDKEFQGVTLDVLEEISKVSGLKFKPGNDLSVTWKEIMQLFDTGEITMVQGFEKNEERMSKYLFSAPYSESSYALITLDSYQSIGFQQLMSIKVGTIEGSAAERYFTTWFGSRNQKSYNTVVEVFKALDSGEIDAFVETEYSLLSKINFEQKSGYKLNLSFGYPTKLYFGFNQKDEMLCSIISKAEKYVDTDFINAKWKNKSFDYTTKLNEQRSRFMQIIINLLIIVLSLVIIIIFNLSRKKKRLKVLVEERTSELARALDAKSEFLAKMSHEIRTPLNVITGITYIIQQQINDKEKSLEMLEKIQTSSEHLVSIVNDILDMAKIDAGSMELSEENFELYDDIISVTQMLEAKSEEKGINIIVNAQSTKDTYIMADKRRLNQVIVNLLSNAIKFSPENSKVFLDIDIVKDNETAILKFSVEDSGIGMSKEQQERLFIPFSQADASISQKYGGTGLGLSISQHIVKAMGGEIFVESELNKGSKFFFEIKVKMVDKSTDEKIIDVNMDLSNLNVLIVEDIEINRMIIKELLSSTGANIIEAVNGEEAVSIFAESTQGYFSIILMDIQMPIMNGYQATMTIRALDREDAKEVTICAMTADAYKEDIEKAKAVGMDHHISKPINIRELVEFLKTVK